MHVPWCMSGSLTSGDGENIAWRHQATELPQPMLTYHHLSPQEMPQPLITKICLKITYLKFYWNSPGARVNYDWETEGSVVLIFMAVWHHELFLCYVYIIWCVRFTDTSIVVYRALWRTSRGEIIKFLFWTQVIQISTQVPTHILTYISLSWGWLISAMVL